MRTSAFSHPLHGSTGPLPKWLTWFWCSETFWTFPIRYVLSKILLFFSIFFDAFTHLWGFFQVLGLTAVAWSNSIGDMIADVSVARKGFPRMAFAAAIGSPLFSKSSFFKRKLFLRIFYAFQSFKRSVSSVKPLHWNFLKFLTISFRSSHRARLHLFDQRAENRLRQLVGSGKLIF